MFLSVKKHFVKSIHKYGTIRSIIDIYEFNYLAVMHIYYKAYGII